MSKLSKVKGGQSLDDVVGIELRKAFPREEKVLVTSYNETAVDGVIGAIKAVVAKTGKTDIPGYTIYVTFYPEEYTGPDKWILLTDLL